MSGPHGPEHVDFELLRIRDAVAALRSFNPSLDRTQAAVVLPYWPGYRTLTDDQRAAVLGRFSAPPDGTRP